MSLADKLRGNELFAHLGERELEAFAGCFSRSRYPAGVTVIKQGDTTWEAYLVESGEVTIQRETPYGQFALASLGPGQLFGETSFIDREPRSGDVVTASDCYLLVMNPLAAEAVLERDPHLGLALHWAIWRSLSRKLRETNEKLSRFFSSTGKRPSTAPPPTARNSGVFRVAMTDKRALFAEQKLSNLEINFLSSLSRERKVGAGQVLFREGDEGDAMYIVLEGRVMISKFIPGAGEEALAFLERGDYFGEMALIDQQPRSADAKAHEGGAVVLALPREVVAGLLDVERQRVSSLRLLRILCSLVAKRLREVDDKIIGWYILAGGGDGSEQEFPAELREGLAELDLSGGLVGREVEDED